MTESSPTSSASPASPTTVTREDSERCPLEVRHGRKIMDAVQTSRKEVRETHRDVVGTKTDTSLILDLLSPKDEPDPVMEILEKIEHLLSKQLDEVNQRLIRIEQQLAARPE
jgi:hypothetical protein